jgi:drug/metabolite transporter (DMT)-like permease
MTSVTLTGARSAVLAGIGMMVLGIFMFALNDVMGKWLVATYTVGQVLLLRSAAALAVLTPYIARTGWRALVDVPRPRAQILRVACATGEVGLFYWAVTYLPLADVMTYWLAAPIYVVAISGLFLGERVTFARWLCVAAGFAGVLVALWPSPDSLTLPALICIAGSVLFAAMVLLGRQLRGTPDLTLVTWQTAGALVAGLALAPFGWVAPTARDLVLLGLLGIVAMLAHVCVTRSLKLAPASVVTPYQYTLIVWAIVFGWLVFGDVPEPHLLAGAAIIVGSGLALFLLEVRERRAPDPPMEGP